MGQYHVERQEEINRGGATDRGRGFATSGNELCRAAIEGSPDAIVVADQDLQIVLVNKAACRLTGYAEAELLGMNYCDLGGKLTRSVATPATGILAADTTFTGEATLVRCDRTPIDVEFTRWQVDLAGARCVATVLRDATPRRKTEQMLRDREEAYRHIVELASDGIAIIQNSLIQYANPRLVEMWGGTIVEVLHTPFSNYVHPDELPRVLERHERRMAGEPIPSTYETVLLRKDGSEFPAELNAGVFAFHGEAADFVFVRDIRERRRAEQALRENERRYAALFDNSNDGVFIFDLNLVHLAVNRRGAEMIGYTVEELIGKPITETADPRELSDIRRRHAALLAGERVGIYPRMFRAKDGSPVPVEVNLSLVRDSTGRPLRIQSVIRDVRKRRQAERALQEYADRLRALATRLAEVEVAERKRLARELHDQVGQNLTALALNLNLIASQVSARAPDALRSRLNDSLTLLEETTGRIRDVMADLRPPVLEDYGLMAALRRYGEQFGERTGISVSVRGNDSSPRLSPHVESALFRIAQEALTNVVKHAQAKAASVALQVIEGRVRLEIQDDGIGFHDASSAAPAPRRGMGMMSMTERADSVGGTCHIHSLPGEGTQVIVEVPR